MTTKEFFYIFDNYPDIDETSKTSQIYIMNKFNYQPHQAKELLSAGIADGMILVEDNPSKLSSYLNYYITPKGLMVFEELD